MILLPMAHILSSQSSLAASGSIPTSMSVASSCFDLHNSGSKKSTTLRLRAHQLLDPEERAILKHVMRVYRQTGSLDTLCASLGKIIISTEKLELVRLVADMFPQDLSREFLKRCKNRIPMYAMEQAIQQAGNVNNNNNVNKTAPTQDNNLNRAVSALSISSNPKFSPAIARYAAVKRNEEEAAAAKAAAAKNAESSDSTAGEKTTGVNKQQSWRLERSRSTPRACATVTPRTVTPVSTNNKSSDDEQTITEIKKNAKLSATIQSNKSDRLSRSTRRNNNHKASTDGNYGTSTDKKTTPDPDNLLTRINDQITKYRPPLSLLSDKGFWSREGLDKESEETVTTRRQRRKESEEHLEKSHTCNTSNVPSKKESSPPASDALAPLKQAITSLEHKKQTDNNNTSQSSFSAVTKSRKKYGHSAEMSNRQIPSSINIRPASTPPNPSRNTIALLHSSKLAENKVVTRPFSSNSYSIIRTNSMTAGGNSSGKPLDGQYHPNVSFESRSASFDHQEAPSRYSSVKIANSQSSQYLKSEGHIDRPMNNSVARLSSISAPHHPAQSPQFAFDQRRPAPQYHTGAPVASPNRRTRREVLFRNPDKPGKPGTDMDIKGVDRNDLRIQSPYIPCTSSEHESIEQQLTKLVAKERHSNIQHVVALNKSPSVPAELKYADVDRDASPEWNNRPEKLLPTDLSKEHHVPVIDEGMERALVTSSVSDLRPVLTVAEWLYLTREPSTAKQTSELATEKLGNEILTVTVNQTLKCQALQTDDPLHATTESWTQTNGAIIEKCTQTEIDYENENNLTVTDNIDEKAADDNDFRVETTLSSNKSFENKDVVLEKEQIKTTTTSDQMEQTSIPEFRTMCNLTSLEFDDTEDHNEISEDKDEETLKETLLDELEVKEDESN